MRIYIGLFLLLFAAGACVEPYEPEVGRYESALVVDGLFNNGESPSFVFLSLSFPYSEREGRPVEGATVAIEEEQGGRHQLAETKPGVYQTDPAAFKGQVGRRYRLTINTPDGRPFESDWEEMKPAPPIEELYAVYEEKTPDNPDFGPVAGVQIYLSAQDAEMNTRYYRWEYEETYQFGLRHPPVLRVVFGERPGSGQDQVFFLTPDEYEGGSCWKTERSTQVLAATTENLARDLIKDQPLLYVDNTSSRLYLRYSLLVKQYAISKDYYHFLRKVEEVNETTGSLFDPIPNEVLGNVRSAGGEDVPVLGYFAVAGVSERRIFVNRDELPFGIGAPFGPQCRNDTISIDFRILSNRIRLGGVLYDYQYNELGNPIGFILTQPPCASCAANGATNRRPDFW